jgi:uncharacterized protein (TIGR03905 family)
MYEYITKGTCSTKIRFKIEDGKLYSVEFEDGCEGNLKAVSILLEGTDAAEAVKKLKGLRCGNRKTSCCGELAAAVEKYSL